LNGLLSPSTRRSKTAAAGIYALGLITAAFYVWSLTTHQSRNAVIWHRFSWPVFVVFALTGVALVGSLVFTLRFRDRLVEQLLRWLPRLPADALIVTVLASSGLAVWLFHPPPFGFMTSVWFRAALGLTLMTALAIIILRYLLVGPEPEAVTGLWSFVFAAVLVIVAAYFPASSATLGLVVVVSPLVGYGLWRATVLITARPPGWIMHLPWAYHRHTRWLTAGVAFALALFTLAVYGRATQHGLLNLDEILWVNFAFTHAPLTVILQPATRVFVRPLFQLQALIDYRLFGLHYAGYVLVQLGLVWLSAVALFALVAKLSRNVWLAALLAALVIGHRFVSSLVSAWTIDTITINAGLAVLALYVLTFLPTSRVYYVTLGAIGLLACLSRENGLITMGAVGFSAALRLMRPAPEKARAVRELAVVLGVLVGYLGLRQVWLGAGLPQQLFIQETCLGTAFYWSYELAALPLVKQAAVVAYTIAANLTAPVLPFLFDDVGCLAVSDWSGWLVPLAFVLGGTALCHTNERRAVPTLNPNPANQAWQLGLLAALVAGGPLLQWAAVHLESLGRLDRPDLWLHGAATLIVLYTLLRLRPSNRAEVVTVANVVGTWLGSALIFGLYFRYRNFYLLVFAWALLVAIGWRTLTRLGNARYVQATLGLLLVASLVVNLARVRSSLPVPGLLPVNFDSSNAVCRPGIADAFALEWARWYALEPEVAACRAQARCDPEGWQLPYGYGPQTWTPSPQDNCGIAP